MITKFITCVEKEGESFSHGNIFPLSITESKAKQRVRMPKVTAAFEEILKWYLSMYTHICIHILKYSNLAGMQHDPKPKDNLFQIWLIQ